MGFRFRKQIKIAPGVKINLGKKSASVSIGGKGLTQTFSTTGKSTTTVGIPGSGMSFSTTNSPTKNTVTKSEPAPAPTQVRDLEHLDENGELPVGWEYANKHLTQPVRFIFTYLRDKYTEERHNGVLAKYASLRAFVLYMEDMRKSCASKGECFLRWSYDLASPSYLEDYKKDLTYMEENMDNLLRKEKIIQQLKTDLLEIIKAEPGVVQSDLYKRFDPELKSEISNQLYLLSHNGSITREKSGRSYKLFPITGECE